MSLSINHKPWSISSSVMKTMNVNSSIKTKIAVFHMRGRERNISLLKLLIRLCVYAAAGPTLCHCASNVEDYRITAFFSRLKGPRGLFGPMDPS